MPITGISTARVTADGPPDSFISDAILDDPFLLRLTAAGSAFLIRDASTAPAFVNTARMVSARAAPSLVRSAGVTSCASSSF